VRAKAGPIVGMQSSALHDLPVGDLLIRFGFGAAVSAVAGIVSVVVGSEPGGILLAFPAILPATLTLIEKEESERQAEDLDVGAILGAAALAAFAAVVWQFMGSGSAPVVLLASTGAWLGAAVLLYLGLRVLVVRQDPLHKAVAELHASTREIPRS
jgi:uncharacterized membrane protein (GlpM family)